MEAASLLSLSKTRSVLRLPLSCPLESLQGFIWEVYGTCLLTVLSGQVNINGALIGCSTEKKSLYISAPKEGAPVLIFPCIDGFEQTPTLDNLTIDTKCSFEDVAIVEKSTIIVLDSLIDCEFKVFLSPSAPTTAFWIKIMIDIIQSEYPTLMVSGSKNVGKSTFCRIFSFITKSHLLAKGRDEDVYVADFDIGQPEYGPPGTMSLTKLRVGTDPNPPSSKLISECDITSQQFIGTISMADFPRLYIDGIKKLKEELSSVFDDNIVIINCPGWTKSFGTNALRNICETFNPTHVVEIIPQNSSVTFIYEEKEGGEGGGKEEEISTDVSERLECVKISREKVLVYIPPAEYSRKMSYVSRGNNFLVELYRKGVENTRILNTIGIIGKMIETENRVYDIGKVSELLLPKIYDIFHKTPEDLEELRYLKRSLKEVPFQSISASKIKQVDWSDSILDCKEISDVFVEANKKVLDDQICGMLGYSSNSIPKEGKEEITGEELVQLNKIDGLDTIEHPFEKYDTKKMPNHEIEQQNKNKYQYIGICYVQLATEKNVHLVTSKDLSKYETVVLLRPVEGVYQIPRSLISHDMEYVEIKQRELKQFTQ